VSSFLAVDERAHGPLVLKGVRVLHLDFFEQAREVPRPLLIFG
jgi:hypothetical protein